jgi:nicotinamidase-related amidase
MAARKSDLHGSAPDSSAVALLIIDMINDLEFEGGAQLLPQALAAAKRIAALKQRARVAGVPVIYVNDNFGRWRSDFRQAVNHCLVDGVRGRPLAETLRPDRDDYYVLKPKHSAFHATTLGTLVDYLDVERLILTGISGDICVLATAMDAYLRDFEVHVPGDCVASIRPEHNRSALAYMKRVFDARTAPAAKLDLRGLASGPDRARRRAARAR